MSEYQIKSLSPNVKALVNVPWNINEYSNGNGVTAYNNSTTVFRALEIRANAIAEAYLCLKDKDGNAIESHPVLDIVQGVMTETSEYELWRMTESDLLVYPFAIWEKVRNGRGKLVEIFRANPSRTSPLITSEGLAGFQYTNQAGKSVKLDRSDVIYFKPVYNPSDDFIGVSPLKYALVSALGQKNADVFLNNFFQNGASPSILFVSDSAEPSPSQKERMQKGIKELIEGVRNAFRLGFIWGGFKPVEVGAKSLRDLSLSETRKDLRTNICEVMGIPSLLLDGSNTADLTPVQMALNIFYSQTVSPRWKYYADALNNQLLGEFPDLITSGAYFEFDTSDISALQKDEKEIAAMLVSLVEKGIITAKCAALELGYSETDIPEEKAPEAPVMITGTTQTPIETPKENEVAEEIRRYKAKATKAIKAGKPANVEFNSDVIPELELMRIKTALVNCKTVSDVESAFIQPTITPEELLTGVVELARAYRNNGN